MDYQEIEKSEAHLKALFSESHEASGALQAAEHEYSAAKSAYEIESADARMQLREWALKADRKMTQAEVEDRALLKCAGAYTRLNAADATQKALRHNVRRVEVQIDITRSLYAGARAAMNL
jgi:hypothetical protein